jgi:hypothetical protein
MPTNSRTSHIEHMFCEKPPSPRRAWRRSRRIVIPDRTSSLSQKPKRVKSASRTIQSDPISLHNRSCKLFSSIDEIMALTRETPPPRYSQVSTRSSTRPTSQLADAPKKETIPTRCFGTSTTSLLRPQGTSPSKRDSGFVEGETQQNRPPFNTVMSWTSDETRRRDYEKIDRAHRGWRGFVNQILPSSWRCSRRNFFRGECDGDSVRRFRLSVPEKTREAPKPAHKLSCF